MKNKLEKLEQENKELKDILYSLETSCMCSDCTSEQATELQAMYKEKYDGKNLWKKHMEQQ